MVLAERNSDPVRNGRRSRGPSPNSGGGSGAGSLSASGGGGSGGNNAGTNNVPQASGAGTPESSDDDNSVKRNGKSKSKQSEYEEKIRVGRDYQAICPPLIGDYERKPDVLSERALLVWSPTKDIPETKLDDYIAVAKDKYGYNGEQALGMLFWHKHDLERAVLDLANFTPFPDEWTVEDKVLFEQAFQFHGKSFHRIRQMLPDKSIASLVKYYYSWKKSRHRTSAMDRQEKTAKTVANKESGSSSGPATAPVGGSSENGSELGSNEESDLDDKFPMGSVGEHLLRGVDRGDLSKVDVGHVNSALSSSGGGSMAVAAAAATDDAVDGGGSLDGLLANDVNLPVTTHTVTAGGDSGVISGSGGGGIGSGVEVLNFGSFTLRIFKADDVNGDNIGGGNDSNDDATTETTNGGVGGIINAGNDDGVRASSSSFSTAGTSGTHANAASTGGCCNNCGVTCYRLYDSPHGRLCASCHSHWRRTGNKRPTSGPFVGKRSRFGSDRSKRKPPRGMYINHDDLIILSQNPENYLVEGERNIARLMEEVQVNKQKMEVLDKEVNELEAAINSIYVPSMAEPRVTSRWTNEEIQFITMALSDYGKDFLAISKILGTKTEAQCRTFYSNQRRRMNLDSIVKQYEAKQQATAAAAAAAASELALVAGQNGNPVVGGDADANNELISAAAATTSTSSSAHITSSTTATLASAAGGNGGATATTGTDSPIASSSSSIASSSPPFNENTIAGAGEAINVSSSSSLTIVDVDTVMNSTEDDDDTATVATTTTTSDFAEMNVATTSMDVVENVKSDGMEQTEKLNTNVPNNISSASASTNVTSSNVAAASANASSSNKNNINNTATNSNIMMINDDMVITNTISSTSNIADASNTSIDNNKDNAPSLGISIESSNSSMIIDDEESETNETKSTTTTTANTPSIELINKDKPSYDESNSGVDGDVDVAVVGGVECFDDTTDVTDVTDIEADVTGIDSSDEPTTTTTSSARISSKKRRDSSTIATTDDEGNQPAPKKMALSISHTNTNSNSSISSGTTNTESGLATSNHEK